MDIKSILVPVDFSPPARVALDHSIAFARKFRARLAVLNVVEAFWDVMYTSKAEIARIEGQHRAQTLRMLSALVAPEDLDDLHYRLLIRAGMIEDEISAAIREDGFDAVVMGTHGRGLIGRTLIGSVTQHMLRRVTVPVMTVCHVSGTPKFDRILFATDLSAGSDQGFRSVLELASNMRSNLSIVHVVETSDRIEEARSQLNQWAAHGVRAQMEIETLLREGDPVEAIFSATEDVAGDMIVITVRRKGLLARVILGAVAERIVRESHLPVFSIPVPTEETVEGLLI
jgi:nucleotide-binding universal stress UspA family protein